MSRAVITGITGQDGAYLSKYLLEKNYDVIGIGRFSNENKLWRLNKTGILKDIQLVETNLEDAADVGNVIKTYKPDEVYNLAAQSSVSSSWDNPFQCIDFNTKSVLCLVNALKYFGENTKMLQASSSEIFGVADADVQSESTSYNAVSPYGLSKLFGQKIVETYRYSYSLKLYSAILFAHESPLRDVKFVSRKITTYFADLYKNGYTQALELGNVYTKRDWGYAPDYVKAMHDIMQGEPDDFVVASGCSHTVQEFVNNVAKYCDINLIWEGEGISTKAIDSVTGNVLVQINPKFFRPIEPRQLKGDITKINTILGWHPKYTFDEMCKMIIEQEIEDLL